MVAHCELTVYPTCDSFVHASQFSDLDSRHRRSMFGRRAFSVAGPAAWNSLPDYLRDPSCSFGSFDGT